MIVSTGTGATGWCRSTWQQSHSGLELPEPDEPRLVWFRARSVAVAGDGDVLVEGALEADETLRSVAEPDGLVVFGDGIESDRLTLAWDQEITVRLAARRVRLGMLG